MKNIQIAVTYCKKIFPLSCKYITVWDMCMFLFRRYWIKRSNTAWWRHQIKSSSALLTLCAGNSPVTGEFPSQKPLARSFDVFFDMRLNKKLSKQSWGWWFETPPRSLWHRCNKKIIVQLIDTEPEFNKAKHRNIVRICCASVRLLGHSLLHVKSILWGNAHTFNRVFVLKGVLLCWIMKKYTVLISYGLKWVVNGCGSYCVLIFPDDPCNFTRCES